LDKNYDASGVKINAGTAVKVIASHKSNASPSEFLEMVYRFDNLNSTKNTSQEGQRGNCYVGNLEGFF